MIRDVMIFNEKRTTCMQDPTLSLHKTQTKFHRLGGIFEIFVIGSIFSTHPMLTSGIHKAQLTWAHF